MHGAAGGLQHPLRHLGERQCLDPAHVEGVLAAADAVAGLRPVAAAGEQRRAVEKADAPVEFGGDPALHQQQGGAAQPLVQQAGELGLVARHGEIPALGTVGHLHHQRQAEPLHQLVHLVAATAGHHHGGRHGHAAAHHQLVEVELVAAGEDGAGAVDHRHLELLGAAGKLEGVVADRGLGPQPEGVELRQPLYGGGRQYLGLDPLGGGGLDEALYRQGIAAGAAIVLIHQDGELIERRRLLLAPGAHQGLGVLQHQLSLALAQRQGGEALLLAHRPAVTASLEGQLLQRQLAQAVVVAGQPP